MSRSVLEYLRHLLDETTYLSAEASELNKDKFMRDETLKRAFVRSLEVIGEAAKNVPAEFRDKYDRVDWKAIAGMRDRLIHHYFGIDYDIVWDVVVNNVPALQEKIRQIIQSESQT